VSDSVLFHEGAIMRLFILAIPASLLLAPLAYAQSGISSSPESASISTVQVSAPFRLTDAEAETVSGQYALSNGWRLKVEQAPTGVVAKIDHQRPIKLIAISADKFVSRDGNVTMEFNRGEFGDDMVMSYVPTDRLAVRYVVTATLASR
jgi:hypothetical protein